MAGGDSISKACQAAGIGRRTVYEWRGDDKKFAAEWEEAVETGTDVLEDEAIKRAKDGSDVLLIFMLKARRPEKFKDRQHHEHTGKGDQPINYRNVSEMTDQEIAEERARLEEKRTSFIEKKAARGETLH